VSERAEPLELGLRRDGERALLLSPGVGLFGGALAAGRVLTPGAEAGTLTVLGVARRLVVPAAAHGRVASAPPERLRHPVGHGDVLYVLEPIAAGPAPDEPRAAGPALAAGRFAFRAPSSGRFWRRPSPQDPPLVEEGASVADGQSVGLLEVMKTFTRLVYRAGGGLPARAKVVRVRPADGADVAAGDILLELE
jgi:acetyl-CoA carboxylase biotin carboxyl carrier protein